MADIPLIQCKNQQIVIKSPKYRSL